MSMTTIPLGEVFEVQLGKMLDAKGNRGDPYPYLANRNVQWDRCELTDLPTMPFTERDRERFDLRPGDLLVCEGGEVGRTAVWRGEVSQCYFQKAVHRLRPRQQAEPRFALHYMRWATSSGVFKHLTTSTSIAHLTKEKLETAPFPAVPLSEQRRIAAILDEADALGRKRREALALLDDLLQSVYTATVGDANPQHHSWPERTIESLATPDGMRTGPFGSALLHSEFVDAGVAVLGIDNAVRNRFTWAERRFVTNEKYQGLQRYRVYPGDVIVTIMGTTGRAAVVPRDVPLAITTKHLASITPRPDVVLPEYLANAIHRDADVLRQIASKNRGAIMDGLNLGIIRGLTIRLPPFVQQQRYVTAVESIEFERSRHEVALASAGVLFSSLLHRAFSGSL